MKKIVTLCEWEYGYTRGFLDGKTAAEFIRAGNPVSHGDLLSAHDPYAVGYRAGLKEGAA